LRGRIDQPGICNESAASFTGHSAVSSQTGFLRLDEEQYQADGKGSYYARHDSKKMKIYCIELRYISSEHMMNE